MASGIPGRQLGHPTTGAGPGLADFMMTMGKSLSPSEPQFPGDLYSALLISQGWREAQRRGWMRAA